MRFVFVSFISILSLTAKPARAMMPLWDFYRNYAEASFGADSCVDVQNLELPSEGPFSAENPVVLPLEVCSLEKASALGMVLKSTISDFVKIEIRHNGLKVRQKEVSFESAEKVIEVTHAALSGNPFFSRSVLGSFGPVIVFKPDVVQFYCDNLAAPSGYCHFLAERAFSELMVESISDHMLLYTTEIKE